MNDFFVWLDPLRELTLLSVLVRTLLAMVVGGLIGFERGRGNHPAGMRTHMLVAIGSAMVMMTNQFIFSSLSGGEGDLSRLGAQVISGIGFLGAGTILVTRRNRIRGLTTAAGLWVAACLGLAVGIGFYEGAVIGAVAVFIAIVLLQPVDDRIRETTSSVAVVVQWPLDSDKSELLAYLEAQQLKVIEWSVRRVERKVSASEEIVLKIALNASTSKTDVIEQVGRHEKILAVVERV